MTLAIEDIAAEGWAKRSPFRAGRTIGPVTAARQRRTAIIYFTAAVLGLIPWVAGDSAFLKAAGLGLAFPGAGFIASAGFWAILLVPFVLALFALALFAWFGSGMVLAPFIVWLGAALVAGATAGPVWVPAPYVALAFVTAFAGYVAYRDAKRRAGAGARRMARDASMHSAVARVVETAAAETDVASRELSADDIASVRYILDRALQPIEAFNGFDIVDQFQTSSLRYQINNAGYCLAELQKNYLPNFHGYLMQAQQNLIGKYLQKKVWSYWAYETSWGHLNFTNHDPVAPKDNIMLTGWLALHIGMYMNANGDQRYLEPGSLTFRWNAKRAYAHQAQDLVSSVVSNYGTQEFCLYPCEPNWDYPICNHIGLNGLHAMDTATGTHHAADLKDRWLEALDAEFTDESGSIIGLRSTLTGFRFPFPGGELGFAQFMETISPERAWRMWAVGRQELDYIMDKAVSGEARLRLSGRGFDFGNYRSGFGGAYASIMSAAREFGDDHLAAAAQRALDEDCGLSEERGVRRYVKMSNLSNISAVMGRIRRRGDYRRTVAEPVARAALTGPVLTGIAYPDVLVARAWSDGESLELVLYPGRAPGQRTIRIERLVPEATYDVVGAREAIANADDQGCVTLTINLAGRVPIRIARAAQ